MVQNMQLMGFVLKVARRECPIIKFSEEDARHLHHPHDDALVVNIRIEDYNMHRVLVDNGSSAGILYYPAFQQMGIGRERLIPTNAPLVGFGGTSAPLRCNHIVRSSRRLPTTDRQGRDIPSGRLFICLQCYPRATHP